MSIRQAVGWLTPSASARRTDDKPLSDCSNSHIALSQQGKLRGVQRRVCRHGGTGTGNRRWSIDRDPVAHAACRYRDQQARSNACNHRPGKSDHRLHHAFQQCCSSPKDTIISSTVRILESAASIVSGILISFGSCPKNPMKHRVQRGDCCLWLIKALSDF